MSDVWAHPAMHVAPLQTVGSVLVPSAHSLHPSLLCCVAKNRSGVVAAPVQPVGDRAATSAGSAHTWEPTAHRSATLHPVPDGFALELPDTRPHVGRSDAGGSTPGTVQPPEQPAMLGYIVASTKPSRVPSLHAAQPSGGQGLPLDELEELDDVLLDVEELELDEVLLDAVELELDETLLDAVVELELEETLLDAVEELELDETLLDAVEELELEETLLDDGAPPAPPLPSGATDSELLAPHAATSAAPASDTPIHRMILALVTGRWWRTPSRRPPRRSARCSPWST